MSQASQQELSKFVRIVDEFMSKYDKLNTPAMRAQVYATNNSAFQDDYEIALGRGRILKRTIEQTIGAWTAARGQYEKITDTTSPAIGDAIDEIRSWFGYDPDGGLSVYRAGLSGLGAIQLPAAAVGAVWIAGIIASATVLITAFDRIFVTVNANKIQAQNPNVSRDEAIRRAQSALPSVFGSFGWKTLLVGGAAVYLIFGRK